MQALDRTMGGGQYGKVKMSSSNNILQEENWVYGEIKSLGKKKKKKIKGS